MPYQIVYKDDSLAHHGILGQKWGVRRYQNKDGTLTTAGKKRAAKIDYEEKREKIYSKYNSKISELKSDKKKNASDIDALKIERNKEYTIAKRDYDDAMNALKKESLGDAAYTPEQKTGFGKAIATAAAITAGAFVLDKVLNKKTEEPKAAETAKEVSGDILDAVKTASKDSKTAKKAAENIWYTTFTDISDSSSKGSTIVTNLLSSGNNSLISSSTPITYLLPSGN